MAQKNGNKVKRSAKKSSKKTCKACGHKVTVAKGVKISRAKEKALEKRPGGSNTGRYKGVAPKDFAGKAGGTSRYSYPINTRKRAESALRLAHNAPNPEGIKRAVYKKYPDLKPKKKRSTKK
ncbi:MAG: hypothetical protein R3230_01400 [Nitrosopumilaceae archaeon]|nr:hypothetical protein [Nitrosopumilaceae archaeon]